MSQPVLPPRAYDRLNAHIIQGASKQLLELKYMRKVKRLVYRPGEGRFVDACMNLWTPSDFAPVAGPWPHVKSLFEQLFPDEQERGHILTVLAFILQHPAQKVRHALMVRGPQGSGKSSLFQTILATLLGARNVRVEGGDSVTGRFTSTLAEVHTLVLDEVVQTGGWDIMERLKPLITQDMAYIEGKGEKRREATTPKLIVVLSNNDAPLPLAEGERRFYVPAYGPPRRDPDFYEELNQALAAELPGFMHDLLERDVSRFDPNAPPPMTAAKAEITRAVRPAVERQVQAWIEEGYGPFASDIVLPRVVLRELRDAGYGQVDEGRVTKLLTHIGAVSLGQLPARAEWLGRPRCWAIRNIDQWKDAGPAAWARYLLPRSTHAQDLPVRLQLAGGAESGRSKALEISELRPELSEQSEAEG